MTYYIGLDVPIEDTATVNTASRIVDEASLGRVQARSTIWRHLRDSFEGKSVCMVVLKGKDGLELIECA